MYKIRRLESWEIQQNRYSLNENDQCFYYMQYNSCSDLETDEVKSIIKNFKITNQEITDKPSRQRFKLDAIRKIASILIDTIKTHPELTQYLWVPIPPSSVKSEKIFDDRLERVLRQVGQSIEAFNWVDLLSVKQTVPKSRLSGNRNIKEKLTNLVADEALIQKMNFKKIVLFDDVITTGSTFKAAKLKIGEIDSHLKIIGMFIAKAVRD